MTSGSPARAAAPVSTSAAARFRAARARLGGAQKSLDGVPAYLRFVNRRAGGLIAAGGYALGATPTQLTGVSALLSAAGIALIATVHVGVPGAVGVAVLLALGFAFDSADGQLARLRGGGSPAGEWLDHVVDIAKISSLHACVAVALYRFFGLHSAAWLLVPLGFWATTVTYQFAMHLRDQLRRAADIRPSTGAAGNGVVKSVLLLPIDYGLLCVSFVLLGTHPAFLAVYTAVFAVNVVFSAYSMARCYALLSGLR